VHRASDIGVAVYQLGLVVMASFLPKSWHRPGRIVAKPRQVKSDLISRCLNTQLANYVQAVLTSRACFVAIYKDKQMKSTTSPPSVDESLSAPNLREIMSVVCQSPE